MPETRENWLNLVNSCVYYAHQTRGMYQVLLYSVDFQAPSELIFDSGKWKHIHEFSQTHLIDWSHFIAISS